MPQLQPGEYTKQSAADLLGWNSVIDVPQPGTARLYYNSFTDAVHIINSDGDELLVAGGAVTSVFARAGAVTAEVGDYESFYLLIDPTGNQIISGPHALTLSNSGSSLVVNGSAQFGAAYSGGDTSNYTSPFQLYSNPTAASFLGDVFEGLQLNVKYSPSGDASAETMQGAEFNVFVDPTNTHPLGDIVAGHFRGATAGSGDTSSVTGFSGYAVSEGSSHVLFGLFGNGGTVAITGSGNVDSVSPAGYFFAENDGNGSFADARGLWVDSPQLNGIGAMTHYYGLYISDPTLGSTRNPDPWAIYVEAGRNYLGTGSTRVGSLAIVSVAYSTNTNIAVTTGIAEATSGVGGITLTTLSTSMVSGQILTVKKVDSGVGAVTIQDTNSADFDGDSSYLLVDQWQYVTVQWNGTRFNVIGNN